jgi:hypothetical protein
MRWYYTIVFSVTDHICVCVQCCEQLVVRCRASFYVRVWAVAVVESIERL